MKRTFLVSVCLIILVSTSAQLQTKNDTLAEQRISTAKLALIGSITAGAFIYGHVISTNMWWKGEKSKFHFDWKHDWTYALGSDKFGHFYFSYLVSDIYSDVFKWCGISKKKSLLLGSSVAFFYQTYVEVRDGFSKEWGFSWGDFTSNTLGAVYPFLRYKFPVLKNFDFKISYYPSLRFRNGSNRYIIDDYESTYNWLSINVYNFLPDKIKKYYPYFINFAIGHSVKELDIYNSRHHEFYLSLDWSFNNFHSNSWIIKSLQKLFKYYHFPAPAIKIYPDIVWYGLKF